MAIEVRIPTILRTYTGGEKAVDASGATLGALIDDLEANHPGIKERLVEDGGELRRFVNVYVNDEDVRFTGGLEHRAHRRRPGRRSCPPSPVADDQATTACSHSVGDTPLVGLPTAVAVARRPALGEARGPQPDRLDQGPAGAAR